MKLPAHAYRRQARQGMRGTFRPKGIGWLSWRQLKEILAISPFHWTGEGLPCGVAKLTPQGKGGVIELKNYGHGHVI